MRPHPIRRILFAVLLVAAPLAMACEAVLDFDRSPLNVPEEASADDPDTGSTSPVTDAKPSPKDSAASDANDGATQAPDAMDSGMDADG